MEEKKINIELNARSKESRDIDEKNVVPEFLRVEKIGTQSIKSPFVFRMSAGPVSYNIKSIRLELAPDSVVPNTQNVEVKIAISGSKNSVRIPFSNNMETNINVPQGNYCEIIVQPKENLSKQLIGDMIVGLSA